MTTLTRVESLFSQLHVSSPSFLPKDSSQFSSAASSLPQLSKRFRKGGRVLPCRTAQNDPETLSRNVLHSHWLKYIKTNRELIERLYEHDGHPAVLATTAKNGVNICCYRWAPPGATFPADLTASGGCPEAPSSSTVAAVSEFSDSTTDRSSLDEVWTKPLLRSENWAPVDWSKCKGAMLFLHGIGESSRFSLLRLKNLHLHQDVSRTPFLADHEVDKLTSHVREDPAHAAVEEFEGGWADSLTKAGFVVYGMDLQGHGLSAAWKGTRCNVDRLEDLVEDALELLKLFMVHREIPTSVPIFLSGLSMGGCVAARTCQIGFSTNRLKVFGDNADDKKHIPALRGVLFFCPALSAERLKRQFPNRIFIPFLHILSAVVPEAHAARLTSAKKFPYFSMITRVDPLCFTGALPIRISAESVTEMDRISQHVGLMPENFAVKIIQSKHDTMTDPEGSQKFVDSIKCADKDAEFLDYAWHILGKEPGYANTIDIGIDWMLQRCEV